MDRNILWQQTVQKYRAEGVQLVSFEDTDAEISLRTIADGALPPPIDAFLRLWKQDFSDLWHILIQSAATLNPNVTEELTAAKLLGPFYSLLIRAEHGAIGYWPPNHGELSHYWGYLLQITPPRLGEISKHIVLHIPVSSEKIRAAEAVLRLALPPSYRRFLQVTNGLGVWYAYAREILLIYSAGPERADWDTVVLNNWLKCEPYNEIAARWRSFQGVYDYEHIRDWENGEHTFRSDETILVPFGHTYETWCFDRSRPGANGEYPVILWDHETREASDAYPDFSSWFAGEIESYLFG